MASLDELLADDTEASHPSSLDDLLADDATTSSAIPQPSKSEPMPWHSKAATGLIDPLVGVGQLMQNVVPDRAMNIARKSAASIAGAVGATDFAKDLETPLTTEDLNERVRERESRYVAERGDDKLDWWRIGGSLANPLSWVGGVRGVNAIRAGAQSGALQALMQPVASEGNFLWEKGQQAALGGLVGGTLGGALQLLKPALAGGVNAVRELVGASDDKVAQVASERITAQVLKEANIDSAKVDPNLYSAIKQEVSDALKAGVDPDPRVMTNRADAAALPVPVHLTRGQAARDPLQFAWEHTAKGLQGVGEPLADFLSRQNRALIANLNELGANRAVEPFEASQQIIKHIEGVDEALRGRINNAYSAVRNSAGRPARVSTEGFTQAAKNRLTEGRPELAGMTGLADYLPEVIRKQYNDIAAGKLPLTVDTLQFLDRAWGGVQRGAIDDTAKKAIGALRSALNEAPIDDAIGQESMQAYQAARALAKQRFDLIEANPAYKAIAEGAKQSEPDKFFQTFVAGSNVSQLKGLKQLIGPENTQMLQNTLIGNLKRTALNRASDENATFSQAAYNKVLHDPVQGPRIRELFADNRQTLDQLYRVGRVAENIVKEPPHAVVNRSGTAAQSANIVRNVARSEMGQALSSMLPNVVTGVGRLASKAGKEVKEAKAVQEAISPGVTATPLPRPTQSRLSDLAARAGAVGITKALTEREE